MNQNGDEVAATTAASASASISSKSLTLLKSALGDIKSGRLSGQLPKGSSDEAKEAALRERADKLVKHLASNGRLPSAKAADELRSIVNQYFGLLGWLKSGESLDSKTLRIDFRSQNGSVHPVDCDIGGSVRDLQAAIAARVGGGVARQLLCNGRPMCSQDQGLYELAASDGLGVRAGVAVQEVARTIGG